MKLNEIRAPAKLILQTEQLIMHIPKGYKLKGLKELENKHTKKKYYEWELILNEMVSK